MSEENTDSNLEDTSSLNYTLDVRKNIIKEMVKDGKYPQDTGGRMFLISLLDGSDRTVLSRAKLKVDKDNSKSNQETAQQVALLLNSITTKRKGVEIKHPSLPADLPPATLVPGETDVGVADMSYNKMFGIND